MAPGRQNPLFNNKGAHHLFLSMVFFFLAIVGGWFMYRSYKEGQLKENITLMLDDFKSASNGVVTDPHDQHDVNEKVDQIRGILDKYTRRQ